MRQLTDSEQTTLARGRTELFDNLDKTESNYPLLLLNNTYFEAFTAGLDTAAEQMAALEAERDGLRAEVARLQKFAEATAVAALKYDNATYLVKKYPSNGRYQRNLKKIYDQLQEARRLVGDPQPTEF